MPSALTQEEINALMENMGNEQDSKQKSNAKYNTLICRYCGDKQRIDDLNCSLLFTVSGCKKRDTGHMYVKQ